MFSLPVLGLLFDVPNVPRDQRKSAVWQYFTLRSLNSAECSICGKVLARKNSDPSGLRNHLRNIHKIAL